MTADDSTLTLRARTPDPLTSERPNRSTSASLHYACNLTGAIAA
jgi:hypothetical protein